MIARIKLNISTDQDYHLIRGKSDTKTLSDLVAELDYYTWYFGKLLNAIKPMEQNNHMDSVEVRYLLTQAGISAFSIKVGKGTLPGSNTEYVTVSVSYLTIYIDDTTP